MATSEACSFFLKINGVEGEAGDQAFDDQIEVLNWSYGGSNPVGPSGVSGLSGGNVQMGDVSLTLLLDKGFTKLEKGLTTGQHFSSAVLSASKTGSGNTGEPFFTLTLTNCMVTSLVLSGNSETPMVNMTLAYLSKESEYFTQNDQGALSTAGTHTYNRASNLTS